MIRTIKGTKVTVAVSHATAPGQVQTNVFVHTVPTKDSTKAVKQVNKMYPKGATILETEPFTAVYEMDDDFFIANAKLVGGEENN